MAPRRVVVVGAGPAGLAAAGHLARTGFEVCVLEREARPGGRLVGESRDGFALEPGGHVFSTADAALGVLLADRGLGDALLPLRSAAEGQLRGGWIHEERGEGWLRIARLPGVGPRALRTWRLPRLLHRFGTNLDPFLPEAGAPQDDRSVADFARLYFGDRVYARWAAPRVACDALQDPEEASRVLLLRRLAAEWPTARTGRSSPAGARRPDAPAAALARHGIAALVEGLARGLDLHPGAEVFRIEDGATPSRGSDDPAPGVGKRRGGGPGGALVRFREGDAEGTVGADAVVVAVPAPEALAMAERVLSTPEREILAATTYAPAVSLELALGDPLVPRFLRLRVPPEEPGPLASLSLEPGRPDGRVPSGCAVARLVARPCWSREHLEAPEDAIRKALGGAFLRLFPAAMDRVRSARVSRWPRALPRFDVGRYRALARFRRAQEDRSARGRRVYFAGDHLFDPSVEGAVASGLRAAEGVRAALSMEHPVSE